MPGPKPVDPLTRYLVDPESGCWEWKGSKSHGYGNLKWRGIQMQAHRWFAMHFKGPIHPRMEVCHRCDNPSCVNPDHLWLGTRLQNQQDKAAKGRSHVMPGEKNHQAQLTEQMVIRIWDDQRGQGEIAKEYGVHRTTVNLIKSGKKWGWLTSQLGRPSHRHPMGPIRRAP